jgi:hypothetical protein
MILERLLDVLDTWLRTGRFPREELRVRWSIAVPFGVMVHFLAIAFVER